MMDEKNLGFFEFEFRAIPFSISLFFPSLRVASLAAARDLRRKLRGNIAAAAELAGGGGEELTAVTTLRVKAGTWFGFWNVTSPYSVARFVHANAVFASP